MFLHGGEIHSNKQLAKIKRSEREGRLYRQAGGRRRKCERAGKRQRVRPRTAAAQRPAQFPARVTPE